LIVPLLDWQNRFGMNSKKTLGLGRVFYLQDHLIQLTLKQLSCSFLNPTNLLIVEYLIRHLHFIAMKYIETFWMTQICAPWLFYNFPFLESSLRFDLILLNVIASCYLKASHPFQVESTIPQMEVGGVYKWNKHKQLTHFPACFT
jgi:hypothetical protein